MCGARKDARPARATHNALVSRALHRRGGVLIVRRAPNTKDGKVPVVPPSVRRTAVFDGEPKPHHSPTRGDLTYLPVWKRPRGLRPVIVPSTRAVPRNDNMLRGFRLPRFMAAKSKEIRFAKFEYVIIIARDYWPDGDFEITRVLKKNIFFFMILAYADIGGGSLGQLSPSISQPKPPKNLKKLH